MIFFTCCWLFHNFSFFYDLNYPSTRSRRILLHFSCFVLYQFGRKKARISSHTLLAVVDHLLLLTFSQIESSASYINTGWVGEEGGRPENSGMRMRRRREKESSRCCDRLTIIITWSTYHCSLTLFVGKDPTPTPLQHIPHALDVVFELAKAIRSRQTHTAISNWPALYIFCSV